MIIYLVCLVTEEMNLLEALIFNMPEAIGLVPPCGEDIKGYLSTNREGKVVVSELLPQDFYEGDPDAMDLSEQVRGDESRGDEGLKPCHKLRTRNVPQS